MNGSIKIDDLSDGITMEPRRCFKRRRYSGLTTAAFIGRKNRV